jgi:hypothetical protein|tara:strand:- start:21 stop:728 length:708 start_codon:yes stop_codon:yes gene_type:complete
MSNEKNLFQKLHSVTENVEKIYKEQNKGMPYKSVNHNMVTKAIRKQIIEQRLWINPIIEESINQGSSHKVVMSAEIIDIDNPTDKVTIGKFPALGIDNQDKGYGKAISYAYKYILQKGFMMEIGEDEEVDAHNIDKEDTKIDYGFDFQPYRYLNSQEQIKQEFSSMADWSKKLANLIYYMKDGDLKNLPTLQANRKEMERVCSTLKRLPKEKTNNVHKVTLETIEKAMEILNAQN